MTVSINHVYTYFNLCFTFGLLTEMEEEVYLNGTYRQFTSSLLEVSCKQHFGCVRSQRLFIICTFFVFYFICLYLSFDCHGYSFFFFSGLICDQEIDECSSSPCVAGICHDFLDFYNCTCEPGYEGLSIFLFGH